jgi:hypothetical protein
MVASHSERAGVLVLGKILATLSEAIVPLAIVRLLGNAGVRILSGLLLALACVASLPAWWFKDAAAWPAGARLPVEAALLLGSFALLGTLAREIRRADWAFLANWLRLRMLHGN